MVTLKRLLFFVILIFTTSHLYSQQVIITNNNGVVHCSDGSIVWVHGSVNNIGDSLYNLGHITICGNLVNNGLISGDGIYEVGAHWINNGIFKHGASEVIMNNEPYGPPAIVIDQDIKGTNITSFYDLTLKGVGIKFTTLNDTVTHSLNLNDRELAITTHELWITNTNPFAITRTSGFVSNCTAGWLYRLTSVNSPYLFPMGSSSGPMRYRPVDIRPTMADNNIYKVGFFNFNPVIDNYDTDKHDSSICMIDSMYYHRIMRNSGTNPADITIYYDVATDGPWDRIVNWNTPTVDLWNNTAPNAMTYFPMNGVVKTNWNTWTEEPYALAAMTPDSIHIDGALTVCLGDGTVHYNSWGSPDFTYSWTVIGGHIVGNATGNSIDVIWDVAGTGIITMHEITDWGYCESYDAHFFTTVFPKPIANFYITQSDSAHLYAYDLIHFVNTSVNMEHYSWSFGDGTVINDQVSPYHIFDFPGQYEVCLFIESPNACQDTICKIIEVEEGLIAPNIFTPNSDGYNDDFYIRCSGMSYFLLQVYNRWGVLVFESNNPATRWDGKSLSGELSSEGTYYYILKAQSNTKNYNQQGTVTLLR